MRSGDVNLYVWGFINPWVIDHSRYISEMIFIRGFFIYFFVFVNLYVRGLYFLRSRVILTFRGCKSLYLYSTTDIHSTSTPYNFI